MKKKLLVLILFSLTLSFGGLYLKHKLNTNTAKRGF